MKECIRILQVLPDMKYGGAEKVVMNYYAQLDHDKYQFDFITHGEVYEYHEKLINQGSKIYYLKTIGRLGINGYRKQVKQTIDLKQYQMIHIHTGHLIGLYAMVFRSLGVKNIISHAHTTRCVNQKHRMMMPFLRYLSRKFSKCCIACGEEAGKFCFGKDRYYLLPNGIDFSLYKKIKEQDVLKLKEEMGIGKDSFVIGHVGFFSKPKNHTFIVELAEAYGKVYENAKFVLVGDGPMKEEIEQMTSLNTKANYVIFTGVRKDIPVLMKMFDVFILPSLHEGMPVVGIEAQAAGTRCLISNTIDNTLDLGLGLTTFLSIDQGCDEWIVEFEKLRNEKSLPLDTDRIHEALCQHGYDVSASAELLSKIYDEIFC